MSEEECKEILLSVLEKSPAVMIDIMRPAVRQPGGPHPDPDAEVPGCCVCAPSGEKCLHSLEECVVERKTDFQVLILDEAVLALARLLRRDILVYDDEPDFMAANRHTAFRQYILWTFGHQGVGGIWAFPSCFVWRIRGRFPDPFGQYTGFKPSRLG